jgi:hypothetical protein
VGNKQILALDSFFVAREVNKLICRTNFRLCRRMAYRSSKMMQKWRIQDYMTEKQ